MIELQSLRKEYGSAPQRAVAVKDLNLTFPAGQITALLGPSGCGKTTTLRMINRLIEPTSGRVLLNGHDTREVRPEELRRGIGYVIQQIGLFPHLTVAQNVATVPQLLGWERARVAQRTDELLELVGLNPAEFAHKRPGELSGGQAQRVGVARALAADPPVLLMDEPFGALDPLARTALQDAFLTIQAQLGKTVVMVTHDIDEALKMGHQIALMNAGELVQFGPPEDLMFRPAAPFVSSFLGGDVLLRQLARISVGEVMRPVSRSPQSAELPRLPARASAREALNLLLQGQIDAIAVEEGGAVVGEVRWPDLQVPGLRTSNVDAAPGPAGSHQRP